MPAASPSANPNQHIDPVRIDNLNSQSFFCLLCNSYILSPSSTSKPGITARLKNFIMPPSSQSHQQSNSITGQVSSGHAGVIVALPNEQTPETQPFTSEFPKELNFSFNSLQVQAQAQVSVVSPSDGQLPRSQKTPNCISSALFPEAQAEAFAEPLVREASMPAGATTPDSTAASSDFQIKTADAESEGRKVDKCGVLVEDRSDPVLTHSSHESSVESMVRVFAEAAKEDEEIPTPFEPFAASLEMQKCLKEAEKSGMVIPSPDETPESHASLPSVADGRGGDEEEQMQQQTDGQAERGEELTGDPYTESDLSGDEEFEDEQFGERNVMDELNAVEKAELKEIEEEVKSQLRDEERAMASSPSLSSFPSHLLESSCSHADDERSQRPSILMAALTTPAEQQQQQQQQQHKQQKQQQIQQQQSPSTKPSFEPECTTDNAAMQSSVRQQSLQASSSASSASSDERSPDHSSITSSLPQNPKVFSSASSSLTPPSHSFSSSLPLRASIVISRLAPQDYHRVHTPCRCKVVSMHHVKGTYYTVNPIAVRQDIDVFTDNTRLLFHLSSPFFGSFVLVMVGACYVGSCVSSVVVGQELNKGDEIGYFLHGGSSVLLLFPRHVPSFDADLRTNSIKKIETFVRMGTKIGTVKSSH